MSDRDTLLGTLDGDGSIGPFSVRGRLAADSGVLTIIGDGTGGDGTVTLELYADAAGTKGGSTSQTMDATTGYVMHVVASPDTYFSLTLSGFSAEDLDFYAV